MSLFSIAGPSPLLVGRRVAAGMLGFSLFKLDGLIADGTLEAVKSGKRLMIVVASIERYVAGLPRATLKPIVRRPRDVVDAAP